MYAESVAFHEANNKHLITKRNLRKGIYDTILQYISIDLNVIHFNEDVITQIPKTERRKFIKENLDNLFKEFLGNLGENNCKHWRNFEQNDTYYLSTDIILDCPCQENNIMWDTISFEHDFTCLSPGKCLYNQGAKTCKLSRTPSLKNARQQCCYYADGYYMNGAEKKGGSTIQRDFNFISHILNEVIPFSLCCIYSKTCNRYYELRPSSDCSKYHPPRRASGIGDPHIITLDGLQYTFNGLGEFILIETKDFIFHGRTGQVIGQNGQLMNATSWQGLVLSSNSTKSIEIHVIKDIYRNHTFKYLFFLNGTELDYFDVDDQNYIQGGIIIRKFSAINIILDLGIQLQVSVVRDVLNFQIILQGSKYQGATRGLLGNMNDDPSDDFTTPDNQVLPINSTSEIIYHQFGMKWRVDPENSIFQHHDRTRNLLLELTFVPIFEITPSEEIKEACGNNVQCMFDYTTTGVQAIAMATKLEKEIYIKIQEKIKLVYCKSVENPANGHITGHNFEPGGILHYECDNGYYLEGLEKIQCLKTLNWSDPFPRCISKNVNQHLEDSSSLAIGLAIGFSVAIVCCLMAFVLYNKWCQGSYYIVKTNEDFDVSYKGRVELISYSKIS